MSTKMLSTGLRVSVLMVRRTPDVPIITLSGIVEGYDGNLVQIRGRRFTYSSMSYLETDRKTALDKEPHLFVVPLTSIRLIEVVEDTRRRADVVAEALPARAGRAGR